MVMAERSRRGSQYRQTKCPLYQKLILASLSGGLRPPEPPYTVARGGPVPRSAPVARSLRSLALQAGLAPGAPLHRRSLGPHSPHSARVARSLRSLAPQAGFAPRNPYTVARGGPVPRSAPPPASS